MSIFPRSGALGALPVLVRKEILNNLLNLRFALAYFLTTLLLVGSTLVMLADYLTEKKMYDVNENFYALYREGTSWLDPYLWSPKPVGRRPLVTRIFAVGGEKDPDRSAEIAPEFSPYFEGDFKRNPLTNLFPSVDMTFIVGVILSLLIFVLTYDAFAGEREEGTLKLLLAGPVPRDQVMIAKWVGGFLSLIIPLVMSFLVVVMVLTMMQGSSIGVEDWMRILSLGALFSLYIAVIFSLSVAVSVVARSTTTAIMALLLFWVVDIVAVPALSTPAAYIAVNPPGVQESQIAMSNVGVVDWNNFDTKRAAYIKAQLGRDEKDLTESERDKAEAIRKQWFWIYLTQKVEDIIGEGKKLTRDESRVEGLARWIARFSPYGCLQNAAVALANTGMDFEKSLRASAEDYSRKHIQFVREYAERNAVTVNPAAGPRFVLQKPGFVGSVVAAFPDVLVLILMGALFFLFGFALFLKSEAA